MLNNQNGAWSLGESTFTSSTSVIGSLAIWSLGESTILEELQTTEKTLDIFVEVNGVPKRVNQAFINNNGEVKKVIEPHSLIGNSVVVMAGSRNLREDGFYMLREDGTRFGREM